VASHAVEFFRGLYNTARNREHAAFVKAAVLSSEPFFQRCPPSTRGVKGREKEKVDYMSTMNLARELITLHEEFILELMEVETSFNPPTCHICGRYWCAAPTPVPTGSSTHSDALAAIKQLFDTLSDGLISEE